MKENYLHPLCNDRITSYNVCYTKLLRKMYSGTNPSNLMPFDIYNIAKGNVEGDSNAAKKAFIDFGKHLGDSIATLITLFDGSYNFV